LANKVKGSSLPTVEVARLVRTIALAVHAVHQAKIVHRDLKPSNVLLSADGTPKLAGSFVAKWLDRAHTSEPIEGRIVGTLPYMAPEQIQGCDVGPLADVYALGVILYECLTSRRPFDAPTIENLRDLLLHEKPTPPIRLRPRVPQDLNAICLKCLEKEHFKRYTSAAELAEDLSRFLEGRPIRARPISYLERGWRWCRRTVAALAGRQVHFSKREPSRNETLSAETAGIEQLHRVAREVLAERDQQREAWGTVDDNILAKYLDGSCSANERALVEEAMRLHPDLREALNVARDALDTSKGE
jgi:serine/threonine protein kinase